MTFDLTTFCRNRGKGRRLDDATQKGAAIPAAPGIVQAATENVLVLEHATREPLEIIRARASELAAVIVEPLQSRRPDFQPAEFLRALRTITSEAAAAVYIWDEIVTALRGAPGSVHEHCGLRADLATNGVVIGADCRSALLRASARSWTPSTAARAVRLHIRAQGVDRSGSIAARAERFAVEFTEYF
jgi:glutamate-1-semialdehyde aminotransferase